MNGASQPDPLIAELERWGSPVVPFFSVGGWLVGEVKKSRW